jgi:hypothetical protein
MGLETDISVFSGLRPIPHRNFQWVSRPISLSKTHSTPEFSMGLETDISVFSGPKTHSTPEFSMGLETDISVFSGP